MRNVPWQGEMDPGTTPLNPADFVAVTRYTQDMSLLNSKILNVGEVAEFACNRITDINKTLTEVTGSVEELTADMQRIFAESFAQINKIDQAIFEAEKEVEEGSEPISMDSAMERLNKKYYG